MREQLKRLLQSPLLWLLILTTIAYQFIVVPYWKISHDSAIYISLASALAHGEGYTYMGYPYTKYTPGFPLILMPIELLFGHNYLLMRWLIVLCAIGSVGMSYLLMRRIASDDIACVVSIATAASYAMFYNATYIASDLPYMFISLTSLYAIIHYRQHLSKRNAFLTIMLILTASSIRPIGFTLALATAMTILLDKPVQPTSKRLWHAIAVVVAVVLVMGLWAGRNAIVKTHSPPEMRVRDLDREFFRVNPKDIHSRTIGLTDLLNRIRKNLADDGYLTADILTARQGSNPPYVYLLSAMCLLGWGIGLFRQRSVLEYYTFFYGCVFLLWPYNLGERFLIPILPMIFYYTLQPLVLVFDRMNRYTSSQLHGRIVPILRTATLILITLGIISLNSSIVVPLIREERQKPYPYGGPTSEFTQVIEWVRNHTPENSVIAMKNINGAFLISNERKSFMIPMINNPQERLDIIMRNGVTHVITINTVVSVRDLNSLIRRYPKRFREIHRIGEHTIYEVR